VVSRLRGVPLVFDYQGSLSAEMVDHQFLNPASLLFRPVQWLEHAIERLPAMLVTSSASAAHTLQARHPRVRVRCLTDAVDTARFRPAAEAPAGWPARSALRARLGIPAGRDVVGYVGLLAEYQGVGDLIYAARRIVERRPHTHFLIMGYPGLERYRRQAYDLQILDNVTFTGRVPYGDLPAYLSLADVAVSAKRSTTEANGKLLNYMAMGLPTVAADTPIARELLGEQGVYAAPRDVAGLADELLALLDDRPRRQALGARLRDRVVREFSWDAFGARLTGLYDECASAGEGRPARPANGAVELQLRCSRPGPVVTDRAGTLV
jgi:glycosyltransferase involved in cell wall biosynthesis